MAALATSRREMPNPGAVVTMLPDKSRIIITLVLAAVATTD